MCYCLCTMLLISFVQEEKAFNRAMKDTYNNLSLWFLSVHITVFSSGLAIRRLFCSSLSKKKKNSHSELPDLPGQIQLIHSN